MLLALFSLLACTTDVNVNKRTVDDDSDGYAADVDCDDAHATVNPDADEVCDGLDNDCDESVDEEPVDGETFYADADGDEAGDEDAPAVACDVPEGFVVDATDCDDADPDAFPGNAETCDGVDDDCDGEVDEDATDVTTFYADADEDGYGDAALTLADCDAPAGYVADGTDCDDADGAVHPDADEPDCTDPTDYNCDGSTAYDDVDLDGAPACEDCDDTDPARSPAFVEVCDTVDVDEDCDGAADDLDDAPTVRTTWYVDADADAYGDAGSVTVEACEEPAGYAADATDCDDAAVGTNPGATEVCDALDTDEDCDGLADDADASVSAATFSDWYLDADGDTYGDATGIVSQCDVPAGYVADASDCDDAAAADNPAATEVCDGAGNDEDCDGLADDDDPSVTGTSDWYADTDADGHGAGAALGACAAPSGYDASADDCDDGDAAVNPDATEVCDAADVDEDCDGLADDDDTPSGRTDWYADTDSDGYGDATSVVTACEQPVGHVADATDCDDGSDTISPGYTEVCDNDVDDDCDGTIDEECRLSGTTAAEDYDAKVYGESGADQFGAFVAGGFDYDGDGLDDLAVGAPGDDDGGAAYGATYVYAGYDVSGLEAASSADLVKLIGTSTYDEAGTTVWAVNDLDADGDDELVTFGDLGTSAANLVLGGTTTSGPVSDAHYAAFVADEAASAGDSDGTGNGDWLASYQAYGSYTGRTYVYDGYDTAAGTLDGEGAGDYSGWALAGGQDIDGDGYDDYAIGAPGDDDVAGNAGAAYVVYAPVSASSVTSLASADVKLTGGAYLDYFGANVLLPGDMDGDGGVDLVVGAERADAGGTDAGAIYLFDSPAASTISAGSAYARVDGDEAYDYLGDNDVTFMSVGDADGDGNLDLLVGASGNDDAGSAAGQAWLIYGPLSGTYDLGVEADSDARWQGADAGDGFGVSGTMASDLDDDGRDDIVIGAPYADEGGVASLGALYVFWGR